MTALISFRSVSLRVARVTMLVGAALATARASETEPGFEAAHRQAVEATPPGVDFAIGLVAQHAQFRVGELIPLDLVYTFDQSDAYQINDDLARGSGTARLLEVFRVSPQKGTRQQTGGEPNFYRWAGGTPRGAKSERVYRYRVYLNEWRRFDQPGKYRFYGTSARVWKPNVFPTGNNELRLTSNLLELEIMPATDEWQDEQLRAAAEVLGRRSDETGEHKSLRRESLRRLRYLDTEAAARELARCYPGRNDGEKHEIGMALYESEYKPAAVAEQERRLNVTDFVVTKEYLHHLAGIAAYAQRPIDFRESPGDQDSREKHNRLWKEHLALEEDLCVAYFDTAWTAAESKGPVVRAQSLFELFQLAEYHHLRDRGLLTSERMDQFRAAVLSVFEQLPARDQELLLKWYWNRFGGADFLPALRRFIAVAPQREEGDDWPSPLDFAFRRVLELAPEEGHSLILAELRRARPRATFESLKLLPDQPIPELDDSLAARLERSMDDGNGLELVAALVARYGSAAIYDRVRKVYRDDGDWYGDLQASMLAYFVRHEPEEGAQLLEQALDARKQKNRYCDVLSGVGRVHMTAELERFAIKRLDGEDLEIEADALRLLSRCGSAAAEQVIWQKFETWHAAWKDRVGELTVVDSGSQKDPQVRFESALVDALIHGNAWFTGPPKLNRMRALCLTKPNRTIIDHRLREWREPVAIHFQAGGDSEFPSARPAWQRGQPAYDCWHIAQYSAYSLAELKMLLARFPAGTTLGFPTGMLTDADAEERFFAELRREVAAHGLKLVKAPPRH